MFSREAEAEAFVASLDRPEERLAVRFMLRTAIATLATDPAHQADEASSGLDLLTFVRAIHASTRLGTTVRDILDGKITSLDDTDYAW